MTVKDGQLAVSGLPETVALLTAIEKKTSAKKIATLTAIEIHRMEAGTKDIMRLYHVSEDDATAISLFSVMVNLSATEFVDLCKPIVARCEFKEAFEATALDAFAHLSTPIGYFALLETEYRYADVIGIMPGDFLRGLWGFVKRFLGELWRRSRDDDKIREAIKECREALGKLYRRVKEIIWDILTGGPSSGASPAT